MNIQDLQASHSYYCSDSNYYCNQANSPAQTYDSWEDFYSEWKDADKDYNMVFRFDMLEDEGKPELHLFYMLQRKGIFKPVTVMNIKEEDAPEITQFLQAHWEYVKALWTPFS